MGKKTGRKRVTMSKNFRFSIVIAVVLALVVSSLLATFLITYPTDSTPKTFSPTGVASGSTSSYYGFSFPFTYQQPSPPKSVGVQGKSGPQVPIADLGPQGSVGPHGHIGPASVSSPEGFQSSNTAVSVQVYDGTSNPLSRSYSVNSQVIFQNISFYTFKSASTNAQGYANFSLPAGWYYLTVQPSSGSFVGFSQLIDVTASSHQFVRYLMPVADSTPSSVDNGPSSALGTASFHVYYSNGMNSPQVSVSVYNASGGNNLLASGATDSRGYLNFTGLNSAYNYNYVVSGYEQSATGTYLGGSNYTGSFTVPSSGSTGLSISLTGRSYWTASVTGSTPQQGYVSSISITQDTTFTGGYMYLSAPFSTSGYQLHFTDTVVYFNASNYNNWPTMYFDNSTVVELTPIVSFGDVGSSSITAHFTNSRVFFSTLNATAPEVGGQSGLWLAGDATNSVFVAPHVTTQQIRSSLMGTFVNSEFYHFNMTETGSYNPGPLGLAHLSQVRVVNSTFSWNNVYIENSILQAISMPNLVNYMSFNNSYVNVTKWSWQNALAFGQTADYNHDFITAVGPYSEIGFGNTFTNYSYCYINFTPKSASLSWPSLFFNGQRISFYNDYITDYPTKAVRTAILNMETSSYQGFGMTIGPHFLSMSHTQLNGMDAIGIFAPSYFFYNFSYVNFSNGWSDQEWNPFEWFGKVALPQTPVGTFNNCTFYGMHFDPTMWLKQWNLSTDVSIGFWQNLNVPNPPTSVWGYIYMNYSTIYNVGIGTNGGYSFAPSEGGIESHFDHNLFYNDPHAIFSSAGTSSWYNGSYFQVPIAENIEHASGYLYLTNNWFLNLTNQTAPVASIISSSNQGTAVSITLANNHFFYYPNKLQSYIPTFATPPAVPFSTKMYVFYPGGLQGVTYPNYSYEIPMVTWGQFSASSNQVQYVFNSSVLQENPFRLSQSNVYAYVIEPDVNTSSGRPVISFANGLVGGLQPNFIWNGSHFQLAVEQNMTYISADSTSAPSVGLQFQVPVGLGTLDLWMYNHTSGSNQLIGSYPEGGQSSVVTVNYDPATMPLGAVFFTNSSSRHSITFSESGLPNGTAWSVSVNGVLSASTSRNITFGVQNGTYSYKVSGEPDFSTSTMSGTVSVQGGNVVVDVNWTRTSYLVTFTETGLDGENWTVNLGASSLNTVNSSVAFPETNGTYNYTITPPANYTAGTLNGTITVNGGDITLNITFAALNTSQPPPSPPPGPTQSPPPGKGTPPSSPTASSNGYRQLIIEITAVSLGPSIVITVYMAMALAKERNPKKELKKKIRIEFKKRKQ